MTAIAVGVASVVAAARNAKRLTVTFYNASLAGQILNLSKNGAQGLSPLDVEYVLNPGVAYSFVLDWDGTDIRNEWGVYSSAAGGILVVGETADRIR